MGAGVVSGYQLNLPDHTTAATAEELVMRMMPTGAAATALATTSGQSGSCAYFDVSSPVLLKELNTPVIGDTTGVVSVELVAAINANLVQVYKPTNVQTVTVSLGTFDPTGGC